MYIADAPYQRLTLIGGEHDWAFVLGPSHLNMLDRAGLIAAVVTAFAVALVVAGAVLCAMGLVRPERPRELPVRHPQFGFGTRRPPVPPPDAVRLAPSPGVRYPPGAMH